MKQTENGRLTEEKLADLEEASNRHEKPWPMGASSHVIAAMVAEIREHRAEASSSGTPG